jgi:signal transduction histidine kinase
MNFFRKAPLQRKQMLIIMLTTSIALILVCSAFAAFEVLTFRKGMVRNVSTMAEMLGNNTAAALDFNDTKAAQETISALKAEPNITGACVYTKEHELFVTYQNGQMPNGSFTPPVFQEHGASFSDGRLRLFRPILQNKEVIGVVYLESDLKELYSVLERYAIISITVFFTTIALSFIISARLQRLVSQPILELVQTTRAVAEKKDYSVRVEKHSEDEIGVLIDGFNEMLAQIEARELALEKTHAVLESRVEERTQELANSLALIHATLESTADGIMVENGHGRITHYNQNFATMWRIPIEVVSSRIEADSFECALPQLKDPDGFMVRVLQLRHNQEEESFDVLEFKDGRVFERYSKPQKVGSKCVGRVWTFRDVTARKKAEAELEVMHRQLVDTSRQAGMAEVATTVLHNVGNVLNSVNISSSLIVEKVKNSKVANLTKVAALLEQHEGDLPGFFANNPKGKQIPAYLSGLGVHLMEEQQEILEETKLLTSNIEHIKEIVSMQQSYARISGLLAVFEAVDLVEDAMRMNAGAMDRHQIRVVREYGDVPPVMVDKHKVLQILVNLIRNAKYALDEGAPAQKVLILRVERGGENRARISVIDNGVGIPEENLTRIFAHGFTTRKTGHGFGLHSGALVAKEMGGTLTVHSDGPGKGASFTLEFPCQPEERTT